MSRMIFNTRERVVSNDHVRLQQFRESDMGEIFRYLMLAALTEDSADGVAVVPNIISTPSTAVIMNGLLVRPQIASTDVFIDPGVAYIVDTTGDTSDDVPAKLCVDPAGVTTPGALPMTPNSSGSLRIDVVECQRVVSVLETQSRDIYNPSTGAFSAATVNKVQANRLTYRIRTGTPGSGFPGVANGWLPLAVVSVPNGASNWDACTWYDVRPLAADAALPLMNASRGRSFIRSGRFYLGKTATSTNFTLLGEVAANLGGRRVGGVVPSTGFDITGTWNDGAFPGNVSASTDRMAYVYIAIPFGLPRWCQYTPASSGSRIPSSFRGIPVATKTKPADARGLPSSAITLPTAAGLGSTTTTNAIAIIAVRTDNTLATKMYTVFCDGEEGWHRTQTTNGGGGASRAIPAVAKDGSSNVNADFTFDDSAGYYPPHASALRLRFQYFATYSTALNGNFQPRVSVPGLTPSPSYIDPEDSLSYYAPQGMRVDKTGGTTHRFEFELDVSWPATYPFSLGLATRTVRLFLDFAGNGATLNALSDANCDVVGWRF